MAKLFKALFAQQRTLSIRLTDLKSHVILSPMDQEELLQACSIDILSSLQESFEWHPVYRPTSDQAGTLLLGINPMTNADGKPHNTPLIDIKIEITGSDTIVLLVNVSTVRFRHNAAAAFSSPATTTTTTTITALNEASKAAEGSLCRVLPTLTPAIIQNLRIASDKEAEKIKSEWQQAGFFPFSSSPSDENNASAASATWHHVIDVRFEEDMDAPTTPFPACAVLSYLGFDPVDTKLTSPGVIGAVQRLQENLKAATYKLFGTSGGLLIKEMRRWDGGKPNFSKERTNVPVRTGFQSAAAVGEAAAEAFTGPPSGLEQLGEVIDFRSLDSNNSEENTGVRVKKPHARAGPEVLAYLAKLEQENAAAAAAAENLKEKKTALPPSMAAAAQASKAAVLKKVPLLGAKRALSTAAAAAATKKSTTKAPKKTAPAAGGASAAASGSKPAAPKAAKPAVEIDVAALNVPQLAANGKLASLTIPQLKAYCRSIKQPVGGKKIDLENRIKAHLGINTEQ